MKKGLLIGFVVLMLAGSVSAGGPYIGIFADDAHSVCSIAPIPNSEEIYDVFVMWIWVLPGPNGMQAVEFKLNVPTMMTWETEYPDPPNGLGEEKNPDISVQMGSLTGGVSSAFLGCQNGWTWTHKRWYSSRNTTGKSFSVGPTPAPANKFQVANCLLGNPLEPLTRLNNLHLYQPCVYGTKDATWGAIKSLF